MDDSDPDKLEAALERLETEKARRLQAKIDSGEVVSVETRIVVGRDENIEEAKARALANLPASTPDGRAIHHDLMIIVTGVPRRDPDFGQWEPQAQKRSSAASAASSEGTLSPPSEEPAAGEPLIPHPQPTYVRIVTSNGSDGDPGAIAEAWWTIEDGAVVLRDADDKHITSRVMLKGDDPAVLARSLLREAEAPKDFNRPIHYPKLGLA